MPCLSGLRDSTPMASASGSLLICVTVALLSARLALPPSTALWAEAALALLAAVALCLCSPRALHPALFAFLWTALPSASSILRGWPFNHLVPLAIYALVAAVTPALRSSMTWLRLGRIDRGTLVLVLATVFLSGAALLAWYGLAKPDLRIHLGHIPSMPSWLFPLAGLAFALVNAAMEEAIFRGILMEALESALGQGLPALVAQAASFALFHFRAGFPNGWWGVAMVFIYGLMLGAIRRRSRGMLAPWLTHVAADIVIFVILAAFVLA